MAKKRIVYGNANYADLVQKQGYFVDKTPYIAQLELVENPVYLRPRRFGKSMFCSLLHYYYDRNAAAQFDELFGQTWIGQHPTGLQNQYMVLPLNFSSIEVGTNLQQLEENFRSQCNAGLRWLVRSHAPLFADLVELEPKGSVSNNLRQILNVIQSEGLPPLFVIIDEYDNFANHLITTNRDRFYYGLTADDSFLKTFFKMLKAGREQRTIANVFITGVLPMTMDDLASAFNVATYLTLDANFEAMAGFTQGEVDHLLDQIYPDYALDPATRPEINALLKNHYDGYHFAAHDSAPLYCTAGVMYFLQELTEYGKLLHKFTDYDWHIESDWLKWLSTINSNEMATLAATLITGNRLPCSPYLLASNFHWASPLKPAFAMVVLFYLGLLTRCDDFSLSLSNVNIRQFFV